MTKEQQKYLIENHPEFKDRQPPIEKWIVRNTFMSFTTPIDNDYVRETDLMYEKRIVLSDYSITNDQLFEEGEYLSYYKPLL